MSSSSLYAATKACNELMAFTILIAWNALTGVRLFTVYGPWKTDMAAFGFLRKILAPKRLRFLIMEI